MAPAATATIWGDVLERFRADHPHLFRAWFHDLNANDLAQGVLQIEPQNQWQAVYLADACAAHLTRAAQLVTDRLLSVNIASPIRNLAADEPEATGVLNPEFTFANFVVGPENQLAHAAARAASRGLGSQQNPILLIGPTGVGKTHLLQAACHQAAGEYPHRPFRYLPATDFSVRFMKACEEGRTEEFRCEYASLDLLALDDVDEFGHKDRSQEELFHILVTLLDGGRQVFLAGRRSPAMIEGLAPRLSSRFTAGLVAPLDHPCVETRGALAATLASRQGLSLSDEAVAVLTEASETARDIARVIDEVGQVSLETGGVVDVDTVRGVLGDHAGVSADALISLVARRFGLAGTDLRKRRQPRANKPARDAAIYLTRLLTSLSLTQLAGFFDLSVAELLDIARRVADDVAQDVKLAALLDEIALEARILATGTNNSCPWT